MCGFFGIFGDTNDIKVNRVINALKHRGPDDQCSINVDGGILGHTRLSIIDLSNKARQPMTDDIGRYTIVYNGEVYNYGLIKKELESLGINFRSNSDTEVILKGYQVWGESLFPKLRGMFALGIYDAETKGIVLVRDGLGIKPLLYAQFGTKLVFGSELKAIIETGVIPKTLNNKAITSLLCYGSIQQPDTIIQGINHLPPGHILRWNYDGNVTIRELIKIKLNINNLAKLDYQTATHELRKRLEDATRANMIADVDVGCFLSGGIDSSAVLALMQKQVSKPIHAISLGFESQNEVVDESQIAMNTASYLGSKFTKTIVTDSQIPNVFDDFVKSLGQPSIDGFNTYLVSREASKYVKVVLSGLGGDELFAGYPHHKTILQFSNQKNIWDSLFRLIHTIRPNRFTKSAFYRSIGPLGILRNIRTIFSRSEISMMLNQSQFVPNQQKHHLSLSKLQNISLAELSGYLCNTLLRDSDAVSMWHGLEVRPVLLDKVIVDFALGIPDDYKIRDKRMKAIFVDAVKDLLPKEVLSQPKRGFEIPLARWMNGVLNDYFFDLCSSEAASTIFSNSYRKNLISRLHSKKMNRRDFLPMVLLSWHSQT
jgi:asparagine synthase (glutamine-hydrolysing)